MASAVVATLRLPSADLGAGAAPQSLLSQQRRRHHTVAGWSHFITWYTIYNWHSIQLVSSRTCYHKLLYVCLYGITDCTDQFRGREQKGAEIIIINIIIIVIINIIIIIIIIYITIIIIVIIIITGWPAGPTFLTFPYFLIQSPTFPYFLIILKIIIIIIIIIIIDYLHPF